MPTASLPRKKMPKATFSQPYMCMNKTNVIINSGKFNDAEVMDFTGYKSVQSLQIYRCVSKGKKMQMSKEISKVTNKTKDQVKQQE